MLERILKIGEMVAIATIFFCCVGIVIAAFVGGNFHPALLLFIATALVMIPLFLNSLDEYKEGEL